MVVQTMNMTKKKKEELKKDVIQKATELNEIMKQLPNADNGRVITNINQAINHFLNIN
jgi:hypothetical protein